MRHRIHNMNSATTACKTIENTVLLIQIYAQNHSQWNLGIISGSISQYDKLGGQIQYLILHEYHRYMIKGICMNFLISSLKFRRIISTLNMFYEV